MEDNPRFILNIACPEAPGVVGDVGRFLADHSGFVREAKHFGDPNHRRLFLRMEFELCDRSHSCESLERAFSLLARQYRMDWHLYEKSYRPRLLVLVSQYGHCLNDLIYQYRNGLIPARIAAVASNHATFSEMVSCHAIPFHHFPVEKGNKAAQEAQILELAGSVEADYIVLARYMQILSDDFCARFPNRIINIHHSLLPGFKGARPHQRAFERGVKMIGATAHFVTPELDEGPIIEQDVARIDHSHTADDIAGVSRDIERTVLTRAVRYVVEHRVLPNDGKTVVFS